MDLDKAAQAFREFVSVIKALRTPGTGCPWDLEQDHHTLRPYLVEETYEVLEAIDHGDDRSLQEELGDLLLQVVLHAQLADDRGAFSITEVLRGITEKMVRRHPHVFGPAQVSSAAEVLRNWEQIKTAERREAGEDSSAAAFDRVPLGLPALLRAQRLGEKAARMRPDQGSLSGVLDKVRRELAGLEEQLEARGEEFPGTAAESEGAGRLPEEARGQLERALGDLLFDLCQLARRLGLSAEESLRSSSRSFVDRFRATEHSGPETAS